jgi:hypothetical protein
MTDRDLDTDAFLNSIGGNQSNTPTPGATTPPAESAPRPQPAAAPAARPAGAPTDMDGAVAIANSMKGEVEKVTEFIISSIEGAERRLAELKTAALDDCARMKAELDAGIVSAQAMVRQSNDIVALVEDIRAKRERVINPGG